MKSSQQWFGRNVEQRQRREYSNYRVVQTTGPNTHGYSPRRDGKKRFIVGRTKVGEEAYVG